MKLKYLGVLLLFISIAFLYFFVSPFSSNYFPKCIFYSCTGYYCPGCGSQRAAHNLLHLNFKEVIQQNILFLGGVIAFIYYIFITLSNTFFNTNYKNILTKRLFLWLVVIIIILFTVLRNIDKEPFIWLAPK